LTNVFKIADSYINQQMLLHNSTAKLAEKY